MQRPDDAFERLSSPLGVVVRESESVRFGVYSDAELRKLSVVQVHSAEQRDAMNRPLPGGLYDPAMGPTDHYAMCPTCGLDYQLCPGHLGRIELARVALAAVEQPILGAREVVDARGGHGHGAADARVAAARARGDLGQRRLNRGGGRQGGQAGGGACKGLSSCVHGHAHGVCMCMGMGMAAAHFSV